MTNNNILLDLKNILPRESWNVVIPSLQHNPLLWEKIGDTDFRHRVLNRLNRNIDLWKPSTIALLAIDTEIDDQFLHHHLLPANFQKINAEAEKLWQQYQEYPANIQELREAGLLAIGLVNAQLTQKDWDLTLQPLLNNFMANPNREKEIVSILSCALGFTKSSRILLRELARHKSAYRLTIESLLSYPNSNKQRREILLQLFENLNYDRVIALLENLYQYDANLTRDLASVLFSSFQGIENAKSNANLEEQIQNLNHIGSLQSIYSLLGEDDKAQPLLLRAWDSVRRLETTLVLNLAYHHIKHGQTEQASNLLHQLDEQDRTANRYLICLMIIRLIHNGEINFATSLYEETFSKNLPQTNQDEFPCHKLIQAYFAYHHKNLDETYQHALPVLRFIKVSSPRTLKQKYLFALIQELAWLLFQLGYAYDVYLTCRTMQAISSNDSFTIHNLYQALEVLCEQNTDLRLNEELLNTALQASILYPDELDWKRRVAKAFERNEKWANAHKQWLEILEQQNLPDNRDLCAYAISAAKIGQIEQARNAIDIALKQAPQDGLSYLALAEVERLAGNVDRVIPNLSLATQYSPDEPSTWLSLANEYAKNGQNVEAISILRNGLQSVKGSLLIMQRLGELLLSLGNSDEATKVLNEVHQKLQEGKGLSSYTIKARNSLSRAMALIEAGHFNEARTLLYPIFKANPGHCEIARLYARACLNDGCPGDAISPLAMLIQTIPEDKSIHLDYARAILEAGENPEIAIQSLNTILASEPENIEAKTMLAEANYQAGEYETALSLFQSLLTQVPGEDTKLNYRIHRGLGKTALVLNLIDLAVASLKQAQTYEQDNLEIQKDLAEAYRQAYLFDEALELGKKILESEPESIDHYIWYARLQRDSGDLTGAFDTIKQALDISPNNIMVLLEYAKYLRENNQIQQAIDTYSHAAELKHNSLDQLLYIAQQLEELGAYPQATSILEQAQDKCANAPNSAECKLQITEQLAQIQFLQQKYEQVLEIVNRVPGQTLSRNLAIIKYLCLKRTGHLQAAEATLKFLLNEYPEDHSIYLLAAQGFISQERYDEAYEYALKAHAIAPQSLTTTVITAEIAHLLLDNRVIEILESIQPIATNAYIDGVPFLKKTLLIRYYTLLAEKALEIEDYSRASTALTKALDIEPKHPRVLALQAILTMWQGNLELANEILQVAIETLGSHKIISHSELPVFFYQKTPALAPQNGNFFTAQDVFAVANAMLHLEYWDAAVYTYKQALSFAPKAPASHFVLMRALVLRAERQSIAEKMGLVTRAPGKSALKDSARNTYHSSAKVLSEFLELRNPVIDPQTETKLRQWILRGQAVFSPTTETLTSLQRLTTHTQGSLAAALRLALKIEDTPNVQSLSQQLQVVIEKAAQPSITALTCLMDAYFAHHDKATLKFVTSIRDNCEQYSPLFAPLIHALIAYSAIRMNDLTTATEAIRDALSYYPDEPYWHYTLADILTKLYHEGQASENENMASIITHLQLACKLKPNDPNYNIKLAKAFIMAGRTNDAIKILSRLTEQAPLAAEPWVLLSDIYYQQHNIFSAIDAISHAIDIAGDNPDYLLKLATYHLEAEQYEKAVQTCNKILTKDGENIKAYLTAARALHHTDNISVAHQMLQKAITIEPSNIELLLYYAELTRLLEGDEETLEIFATLHDRFPNNPDVSIKYADELIRSGQYTKAIETLNTILSQIEETKADEQICQIYAKLGHLYRRTGQLDHAIHTLSKYLDLAGPQSDILLELGRTYHERKEHQKAIQVFNQALQIAPDNPQLYYYAGLTFKSLKDYIQAEQMFRKAAKLAPNDLNIHRQLGAMVAINLVHNRQNFNL